MLHLPPPAAALFHSPLPLLTASTPSPFPRAAEAATCARRVCESCTFDRVTVATLPQVELNTFRRQLLQCHIHSSAQRQPVRQDPPADSPSLPLRLAVRHRNTLCIIKDTFPKRLLAHYSATTVTCLATQNVHFTAKECAHPGSFLMLFSWKYMQGKTHGLN